MSELAQVSAAIAHRGRRVGFAAGIETFGYDVYRETTVRLAVGGRATRVLAAGAAIDATQVAVRGYGATYAAALGFGAATRPTRDVALSLTVTPLAMWARGALRIDRDRRIALDGEYRLAPTVGIVGTLAHEASRGWSSGLGVTLRPRPWVALSLGRTGGPPGFVLGCGIGVGHGGFAYDVRLHPDLPATQTVGATVGW